MSYRLGQGPVWPADARLVRQRQPVLSADEPYRRPGLHQALAYDHPAHGLSEGSTGHLPCFVRAFDEILGTGRSRPGGQSPQHGGAVTLSSRHPAMDALPLLLISPVLDYAPALRHGGALRLLHPAVRCGGQGD